MVRFSNRAPSIIGALTLCGQIALVAVPSTASAATVPSADGIRTVSVSYSDLDLSTATGATIMASRIRHAAHQVCDTDDPWSNSDAECREGAIARAVSDLRAPMVDEAFGR